MELLRRIKEALTGGEGTPGRAMLLAILNAFLCYYAVSALLDLLWIKLGWTTISCLSGIPLLLLLLSAYLALILPLTPKRLLLIPLLYFPIGLALWLPLYLMSGLDKTLTDMSLSALRLASGILTFAFIRFSCGSFLLRSKDLGEGSFTFGYILRFIGGVALVVLLFAGSALWLTMLGVEHCSSGFIRLTPLSLQLGRKTMEKDGKQVVLWGMSHVGSQRFYDELKDRFPARGSIILSEGVSDRKGLLKKKSHYEGSAASVGLTTQPARLSEAIASRNADMDVSDATPETIELLNSIMGFHSIMDKRRPASEMLPELLKFEREFSGKYGNDSQRRLLRLLEDDLVRKRNEHLFGEVMAALEQYDLVIVPWGAWHMPGLEGMLEERGFKCKEKSYSSLF